MASPDSRLDTRLVQTAVFGHARADEPATMPFDYDDALQFKLANVSRGLWCGEWLGGCGQQLSARLYKDRDCHFAHFPSKDPSRPACTRRNSGIDSADHLYIHRGLSKLTGAGRKAKKGGTFDGRLRNGTCTDLTVWPAEVGDRLLQVQLTHIDMDEWLAAERGFVDAGRQVDWLFGARAGPTARYQINRSGYALRIRCEQDGINRIVLVGTETRGKLVWNDAEECHYTSDGLWTPALHQVVSIADRQRRNVSQQRTAPRQPVELSEPPRHPIDVEHVTVRLVPGGIRRIPDVHAVDGRRSRVYSVWANLTDDRTGWEAEAELRFTAPPHKARIKYAYRLAGPAVCSEPWESTPTGLVIVAEGIRRKNLPSLASVRPKKSSSLSSSEETAPSSSKLERPHRADHDGIRRAFDGLREQLHAAAKRGDVRQVEDLIDEARKVVPRNVLFRSQHAELDAADAWVRERTPSISPGKKIVEASRSRQADTLDALLTSLRTAKKRGDAHAMHRLLGHARVLINQAPPGTFRYGERKLVQYERWVAMWRSKAK